MEDPRRSPDTLYFALAVAVFLILGAGYLGYLSIGGIQSEQASKVQAELAELRAKVTEVQDDGTRIKAYVEQELSSVRTGVDLIKSGSELRDREMQQQIDALKDRAAVPVDSEPSQPIDPRPSTMNIDFGVWKPQRSEKTGPAAAGKEGDFWNVVAVPWNDDHTESGLKWAGGSLSPVTARLVNLGGGWGCGFGLGVKDVMLDNFNYPANNKGGESKVILRNIPSGSYDLYLYGHGTTPEYYGDYTVKAGERSFGRQSTSNQPAAVTSTQWTEGLQYVKFPAIEISGDAALEVLIQPGGQAHDGARRFSDAMIAGLQLIHLE